jgi:MFS family permease
MFLSGIVSHSGGISIVVLQEEFGWSKASLSAAFAIGTIIAALLAPVQGRLVDRFGPRGVVRVGVLIVSVGLCVVSFIHSMPTLYLASVLMGTGYTLAFDVAIQTTLVNWFHKRRGAAMGLMMAGFGAGGVLVPVVGFAVNAMGWRHAALAGAGLLAVVGLCAAQVIRRSPEEHGLLPDGVSKLLSLQGETKRADGVADGFTARQAFRAPSFWLLALGQTLYMFAVTAVGMYLVPYAVERFDLPLATAGSLMTAMTICIVGGQVVGGFVGDKLNKRTVIVLLTIAQAAVVTLLLLGGSLPLLVLFVLLQGLIVGGRAPLNMALRADYFGRRAYGTIWGVSLLMVNTGNFLGMVTTGYLADRFDGYQIAFIVLVGVTFVASVLLALARKPRTQAA